MTRADGAIRCDRCGAACVPKGSTTGYGIAKDGSHHCFACCADLDREAMDASGRAALYLTTEESGRASVGNWPGTLRYPVIGPVSKGRHNLARVRYDFTFRDHVGAEWRGTQYGDNTQIARCRRVKARRSRS